MEPEARLLMSARNRLVLATLLLWALAAGARAHEGHDHGAPAPPASATIAPRAETSSADFELVLIARGSDLVIHVDEFRTNTPIDGAALEIDSPAGVLRPAAVGPGVYSVAAPFLAKPGSHDLAITVAVGDRIDILTATLTISGPVGATVARPASWLTEPAVALEMRDRLAAGGVPVWLVFVGGFVAGVAVAGFVGRRRARRSATVVAGLAVLLALAPHADANSPAAPAAVARDTAQRFADGALFVPKTTQHILALRTVLTETKAHARVVELPGRIVPSPNASGLVQATTGGRLSPPPGGFKPLGTPVAAGDVLALVTPPLPIADATAQQQQARELEQQITIAERKLERYRALTTSQSIARSQLEDADTELKGLRARRANLDRARREPEALTAPVAGIIAAANAVAGQMAEPSSVIFQIIDPAVLWVEALSYEAQATRGKARAVLPDGRSIELDYLGTGFADRNQAVPIQFAIRSDTRGLRAGQFVTVLAASAGERQGIAVPRAAVLAAGNGQSIVYEHSNAERFVPREVRVAPLDGERVLIVAGIEPGRRIVAQGAELLSQIR